MKVKGELRPVRLEAVSKRISVSCHRIPKRLQRMMMHSIFFLDTTALYLKNLPIKCGTIHSACVHNAVFQNF